MLIKMMPDVTEKVVNESFTLNMNKGRHIINHLIRFGLAQNAISKKDYDKISNYHRSFWAGRGAKEFYENTRERFDDVFLMYYTDVINELENLLEVKRYFHTLCEIGTGSGQVISYLAERLPGIERFIGIDLCKEQIDENKIVYGNTNLEFANHSALSWIEEYGKQNSVFLTNNGVLEYFTQRELEKMVGYISRNLSPSIFIAIEPLAIDHDLERDYKSHPYGNEFSFSHNYPHIFSEAGFSIEYQKEIRVIGYRMLKICALSGA